MVNMSKGLTKQFEAEIRSVIDTLRSEQDNPPELRAATNRLLSEAERLDACLNSRDCQGLSELLSEMKEEAWKASTMARILPELPETTWKNLEYVQYSLEDLCRQTDLLN